MCLAPGCAKSLCCDVKIKVRDVLKIRVGDSRVTIDRFISGSCRIHCEGDGNERLMVRVSKKHKIYF